MGCDPIGGVLHVVPDVRGGRHPRERRGLERRARDGAESARWWALLVVVPALTALAVWFVSPRFAIDTPSLVIEDGAIFEGRCVMSREPARGAAGPKLVAQKA